MTDKTLGIKITAIDGASKEFVAIGRAAIGMRGEIVKAADDSTRSIKAMEQELNEVGRSFTIVGGAIVAGFGFAAKASITLEASMDNVNSIARLSNSELTELTDTVRDLGVEMGKKPTELADGLYDIQGSGFAANDALIILEDSVVAAGAGMTTTGIAAKAITSVLNAYGLAATEAGNVSDLLFKTVDTGVIRFADLADSLGRVLPTASALQVPIEELTAAYAELTRVGVSASESETGIAALMASALGPTEAMTAAVQEFGFESAEALIQAEGLSGFLSFLGQASGGTATGLTALLGNIRAVNAAIALGKDGGAGYTDALNQMSSAAQDGAYTQSVFAIQTDNAQFALTQLGATLNDYKISIGDALLPTIQFGAEALTSVADGARELPGPFTEIVAGAGAVGGAITLASGAMLLAIPRIAATRAALTTLGGARGVLGLLAGAINPVTLGLGALVVAGGIGLTMWGNHKKEVQANEEAYEHLQATIVLTEKIIRDLNLAGDFELANIVKEQAEQARAELEQFSTSVSDLDWFSGLETFDSPDLRNSVKDFLGKSISGAVLDIADDPEFRNLAHQSMADIFSLSQADLDTIIANGGFADLLANATTDQFQAATALLQRATHEYYVAMLPTDADKGAVQDSINQLLDLYSNPNIDITKLNTAMDDLFGQLGEDGKDVAWLNEQLKLLFTDVTTGADSFGILGEQVAEVGKVAVVATASLADLLEVIGDVESQARELKFDGMDKAAADLLTLEDAFLKLQTPSTEKVWVWDDASQSFIQSTTKMALSVDKLDEVEFAYSKLNEAIASGDYKNAELLAAAMAIISDPENTPDEAADKLELLVLNLDKFVLSGDHAKRTAIDFAGGIEQTIPVLGLGAAAVDSLTTSFDKLVATRGALAAWGEEQASQADARIAGYAEEAAAQEAALAKQGADQQAFINARIDAFERAMAVEREWASKGLALMGIDTVPETINLAGIGTQYTQLAASIGQVNEQISNTFRIVVSNTDAIGQTIQGLEDWATELINVEGEYGKIDDLLKAGVINQNEYNDAQEAYNQIASANLLIQEDILTIQAKQAPILGDLAENQADYMDQLADMPAAQQQIALGWMDANTAAQANEIITLAAAAANGELGTSGKAATTAMIEGAIATQPYLEAMLTDLGLISRDHEGNLVVNFDGAEGAKSDMDMLTESITALIDLLDDGVINGSFVIDVEGNEYLDDARLALADLDGKTFSSTLNVSTAVDGDEGISPLDAIRRALGGGEGGDSDGTGGAVNIPVSVEDNTGPDMEDIRGRLDALGAAEAVMTVDADIASGMINIGDIDARHSGIDGNVSTLIIEADTSDAVAGVRWASSYDGDILARSYIDIVTRYSSINLGGGFVGNQRHGGIPSFGNGGMVPFIGAEGNNPELLHFAAGGTAPIFTEGVYAAPPMTYVSPANANPGLGRETSSGGDIHLHVHGNVYGIDDLAGALEGAITQRRKAFGART